MDIEDIREYCLSLPSVTEGFPFDDETLVFKIGGKIFALLSLSGDKWLNLKCDPEEALEIREAFPSVKPGFHMNKKHWNTVIIDGTISESMLKIWIDKSYKLVASKLTKQIKESLK